MCRTDRKIDDAPAYIIMSMLTNNSDGYSRTLTSASCIDCCTSVVSTLSNIGAENARAVAFKESSIVAQHIRRGWIGIGGAVEGYSCSVKHCGVG